MRLTYTTISTWFDRHAANCSVAELAALSHKLETAIGESKAREAASQKALEQVEAAAKAAGFSSLQALLAATGQAPAPGQALVNGKIKATPRKPYMDPLDEHTAAYAVYGNRPKPPAIQRRLDEGWTLHEMHYERIRAARIARKLPADKPYIASVKHAELMAAEPPRARR